jgi:predicted nucleotidyltransferase
MMPVMDGELTVKVLLIEDLIGLKLQALANDPKNRFAIDAADIQRLLKLHRNRLDIGLVREYFRLFEKEDLLNEWLGEAD